MGASKQPMNFAFEWEDSVVFLSVSVQQFAERVGFYLDIVPVACRVAGESDVEVEVLSSGGFDVSFAGRQRHCENSQDCLVAILTFVSASFLRKTRHLVLHSGAICIDDQAVLFVGEPRAGKSLFALTAWLAGIPLIGDDWIAIDCEQRTVIPFPKTLKPRLSFDSLTTAAQNRISKDDYVEGRLHEEHRLVISRKTAGMVGYAERKPVSRMLWLERTTETSAISPLKKQEAIEILLSQVVPTKSASVLAILEVLQPLVNCGACQRLAIGENESAQAVHRLLQPE